LKILRVFGNPNNTFPLTFDISQINTKGVLAGIGVTIPMKKSLKKL
jgi:hypothetical protein